MKTNLILISVFLLMSICSCSKVGELQFTLYLENTGTINICKTFKVTVDGQEKLTKQICSAGVSPNVTTLVFSIWSGKHTLKTVIIEDSKIFESVVDFNTSQKYGYLTYHNNISDFSFSLNSSGGID